MTSPKTPDATPAPQAPPDGPVPPEATVPLAVERPSRGRAVGAVICLVLAAILTVPSAAAYWGYRTLNDTQRYVDTVGPLVDDPEVQNVIATKVTDAIQQQVDIEAILNSVFAGVIDDHPRLEQLVGPLSAAINGLIDRQVREFIASDAFEDLWITANERAQQGLIRVLEGDSNGAISIQGEEVVLDVSEVIDRVKERLVDRGLTILNNVPIPETDRQIVLLDSPQLKQVRTIYAFSNPVAKWMIVVVALLYLSALLLARRRPRMTVWIGAMIVLNAILLAFVLSVGRQVFINELSGTAFGPAASAFWDQLLTYLERGQKVFLAIGLILAVAGGFAGSNGPGTAVRTTVADTLEAGGEALPEGPLSNAGRWVASNALLLRIVAALLGVVVLLWGLNISMSRLWWSLVLVLVLLAVIQVLVGAGRRTPSTSSTPDQPSAADPA